jgi:hypothetical protein
VSGSAAGASTSRARLAALALVLASGCDARVTSIGAWLPDAGIADAEPTDAVELDAATPDGAGDASGPASGFYLEAEQGELSAGFAVEADPAASGGRYLAPPAGVISDVEPGAARARYTLAIAEAGSYVVWGRIWAPGANANRFWFQLDGGAWHKWRISVGEIWFWDDFHEDTDYGHALRFELEPGAHELVIANCVDGARLDRLYVTAAGDVPPGNATRCDPPHSIDLAGQCLPSCGALQGTQCGEQACTDREQLPAYDCEVCCHVDP